MGELLKKYGTIKLGSKAFDIELNAPINDETGGIVHIQNEKVRLEMSQLDFYELVTSLNLAKMNLLKIKGDNINE